MSRGGKREGAGRPAGKGKYSTPTKPIRVPINLIDKIEKLAAADGYEIPLYATNVQAGFPSPADDYIENRLDLNEHLINHPAATFFVRATGDSMLKAGIHPGDILIVDKSLEARHNRIVIAVVNNELTVKRLYQKNNKIMLLPENDDFEPIEIHDGKDLHIWGVVTNVIHSV